MKCKSSYIGYRETHQFSPLVLDYLEQNPILNSYFRHRPDMDGIRNAISERRRFPVDRPLLVNAIRRTHGDRILTEAQQRNLEALSKPNSFTVCSAHQPNIFTGYLYFVYKIIHSIRLAEACREANPDQHFVPVFVLGSEDNDLIELNRIRVGEKVFVWETRQTGAVGRMMVDGHLISLIDELALHLSGEPYAAATIEMLRDAYPEGITIADATTRLIDRLFAEYGLLVLQPDQPELKRKMVPVFREDLKHQYSYLIVEKTARRLERLHKVQVNPREVNLFYLEREARSRIVKRNNGFFVDGSERVFNPSEVLEVLEKHPERFSPNVVLRGLYQETILPNVAFIGGGSEISYWLELRDLFEHFHVPFPMLVLRNSFLLVGEEQAKLLEESGWGAIDLFRTEKELFEERVRKEATRRLDIGSEILGMADLYAIVSKTAENVDPTLSKHVAALEKKSLDRLKELEKKMLRAEKRRHDVTLKRLQSARRALFPSNGLQERHDNILPYLAHHGNGIIDCLLSQSKALDAKFGIIGLGD